ncbi:AfsR/SARP family transcriptional regulator [Plantactinospora soyae]|uniref:DNA-binding SARP family transcriptional activator/tetratricopeptide (TPR) repeat protein n=1 Tax=Plantactinospora soyae TaxID=1544732 RepID=A0A927R4Q1_9ACTN|nr:BTAD domain-containing putative transcriptional regulator [Plantactinospora soyae]MBE1486749.1 DNA-binding SARP family transcriptional activator/tetratricopeptide (TPR) repeat protein [Plantactinospora soyae]
MQIQVLGPVQVCGNGRTLDVGPRQQRHVLAALAADVGRAVTTEMLMDRVWEQVPPGARRTLHAHITRIRRLLEGAAPAGTPPTVVRRSGGYVLDVDPDRIDVHRMRRLVGQARVARCGDVERAALLREAVELWRGDPLGGLTGSWAARTRERWRREYLDTVVAWAHTEVRFGDPGAVIATLRELTGEHPLVESLAAALMQALYAAGGPAEALEHYATVRRHLADELGVDPGPDLRAMHQAILRGELDPLRDPAAATRPGAGAPVIPRQLPADVPGFTGRAGHLAELDALLTRRSGAAQTAVVISAVSGTAGVGKTALAVHWAHLVAREFPDGQLYVNLRGFDPDRRMMAPVDAVRGFLDALGVPPGRVPAALDAQVALYRSLLADKRVLVVLDNARDAEQVRPLLPATPTALAVVTSRNQLTPLLAVDGARPLILDILSPAEARDLLTYRLGAQRIAAEPDVVRQIIAACARLPLALSIAAARAQQSSFPLATLAGELSEAGRQLDALDAGDPVSQVRAVFSWSVTALSPPAARLFRLLGLHPGPDIGTPAAASLAGHPVPETRRLLGELTRANLLAEPVPGRYTCHDLLRAYAAELGHSAESEHDRLGAIRRVLDHYTHTAHAADRLLHPTRDPIPVPLIPPATGASPADPTDHQQAMAWLSTEYPVLVAVVRYAAETGSDAHAWQLAWALNTFLDRRGQWHDQAAAWQGALHAAGRLPDPARAFARRRLAYADTQLGRHDAAHTHLQHALDLYTRAGDLSGQAFTHYNLGYLLQRQDRYDQALDHSQQALALHRAAGHRPGQGHALNSVGWCAAQLGDHAQALTACEQALVLFEEVGDGHGQASTLDSLGYAHHHLGHHAQAVDCFRRALSLLRDLGHRYNVADVLDRLGETHQAAGDPAAARTVWTEALDILTDLDHPDAEAVRVKLKDLDQVAVPATEPG